jgi:hypothetical protein
MLYRVDAVLNLHIGDGEHAGLMSDVYDAFANTG